MKIKFNSDDKLSLNKTIEIPTMAIVVRTIFLGCFLMNNTKMLYFDIIDACEGIDVNKTSTSKECDICHY